MLVFLDIEASALVNGFPTEVAWVRYPDRASYSALIAPEDEWTTYCNWDPSAEVLTGLSLGHLNREGRPRLSVAEELIRELAGHEVFVDGGQLDAEWLYMITEPAIIPLKDFGGLLAAALIDGGWKNDESARFDLAVRTARYAAGLRYHRALDDAKALLGVFQIAIAGPQE